MRFAPMKPTPRGLWRRTPPMAFAPLPGVLGLGLGWQRAAEAFGLPTGPAEVFLGAVSLLVGFAILTYLGKALRGPAAVIEDLRILPGQIGVSSAVICLYLLAMAVGPFAGQTPGLALLAVGGGAHLLLVGAVLWLLVTGPAARRRVSPVWHLVFAGILVAACAAQGLGLAGSARPGFWLGLVVAAGVWLASAWQITQETVPGPLRPLLLLHLVPVALLGLLASGFGAGAAAAVLAGLSALSVVLAALRARWLFAAPVSPFRAVAAFPLALTALFWLGLPGAAWQAAGLALLCALTPLTLWTTYQTMKQWAGGQLAVKTNASIA